MKTTEKLTVSVRPDIAHAVRDQAKRDGVAISAIVERAMRDYLLDDALAKEPAIDEEWLEAATTTALAMTA